MLFASEGPLATLHIEHPITDFQTWKAAFDRFAGKRLEAGVTAHRIHQPVDDPAYVLVQLDFPSVEQAQAFGNFWRRGCGRTRRTLPVWQAILACGFL